MIGHELDRLTDNERRLLDAASVAGEEFSAALVAAGLSDDAIDVEWEIEALIRKDHILVRSGVSEWPDGTYSGSYAFCHILYQNVIYQNLPPGNRALTHKRLGRRLEEAYAGRTAEIAPALALHFERRRQEEGIDIEFTAATQVYHCLGEYCLLVGDFTQARRWARQLHDYVASAPDLNHLAQAHGLLARIAFGAGELAEALPHLSRALEIVDNADFPIASWRVYAAAADIFTKCGEAGRAATYRVRFVETLRRLAQNFEPEDRLHRSLLAAVATRTAQFEAMTCLPSPPA